MTSDPYNGQTRRQYLEGLAVDFGLPLYVVIMATTMLPASEDFDGLITTLEDAAESGDWDADQ